MNLNQSISETMGIKGIHTAAIYDMRDKRALDIEFQIEQLIKKPFVERSREVYLQLVNELKRLFQVREYQIHNLVTTRGRSVLMQRLANVTTYTGIINYGALGTSSTAVNNADTQLGTEVFRKVVASASYTDNVAFIDFFFSKADCNGTYQEFGNFIDATGAANSGQIFTHALTGGWVKSSSESMTVASQYTQN